MMTRTWTLLLLLGLPGAGAAQETRTTADARAAFERALREADGPASLRKLQRWCESNNLREEAGGVADILEQIRPPKRLPRDHAERERQRGRREQAREAVHKFLTDSRAATLTELQEIAGWMKRERFAPAEALECVRKLAEALDARTLLDGIDHASRADAEEKRLAKEFDRRVGATTKTLAGRLLGAADKCLAAEEPGFAFDLFHALIRVDPENERARRALGQARVSGRWLRPYEADLLRAGWVWDDRLGWIVAKERQRYARGEYFDLEVRRWGSLEDWNKLRVDVKKPWRLQGEHFELVSTADLALTAKVLTMLEEFYLQAFRQYDLFFASRDPRKDAKLILGLAPPAKRYKVHFYRDARQFKDHATPPVAWAAGFYDPARHASYFYAVNGDVSVEVLRHELTHQLLGEFSASQAPCWLAEGAAVYLEEAGGRDDRARLRTYGKRLRAGEKELSFSDVLALSSMDGGDVQANYRACGAAVYFLMHFDGGRYRGDFLQLLRDAYNGVARPIEEYFGLTEASLRLLMERFYGR